MITNFKKKNIKGLIVLLVVILTVFISLIPPQNKLALLGYWNNGLKFFVAKDIFKDETAEYIFHRNNAIYIANMNPKSDDILNEINRAIKTLPKSLSNYDSELGLLYKDRAEIKLFKGDEKGALEDFETSKAIVYDDYLKLAILNSEAGNKPEAMAYCNGILKYDSTSFEGYLCKAYIFSSIERYDLALQVWDLAADRITGDAQVFLNRANVKKAMGDLNGYEADMKLAKQYSPTINENYSLVSEIMHPKKLMLKIK